MQPTHNLEIYLAHVPVDLREIVMHGAFLPDPLHLLEGSPHYKRFVCIASFDQAPWEALRALIQAPAHFDPRTLTNHEKRGD
jgi:hypothetical protein